MLFLFQKNLLILFWISLFLGACGYSFQERPAYFNPEWKSIFIPPFKNYTQETAFGELLAYELRHRFAQGKLLIPTFKEDSADLVLKGEILRIYLEPISYETFLQTRERRILCQVSFVLLERKTNKLFYENKGLSYFETYRVVGVIEGLLDPGKEEALKLLARDISELIFQEILLK